MDRGLTELAREVAGVLRDFPDWPREGVLFRDVTPLFEQPQTLGRVIEWFADGARVAGAEKIVGIESRGFLLGVPVALELGVPFAPARKIGKLPGETVSIEYALEYGEAHIELQRSAVNPGDRAYVVDDLLATGGTAGAVVRLIEQLGGTVCGLAFLIELGALDGAKVLDGHNSNVLLTL